MQRQSIDADGVAMCTLTNDDERFTGDLTCTKAIECANGKAKFLMELQHDCVKKTVFLLLFIDRLCQSEPSDTCL